MKMCWVGSSPEVLSHLVGIGKVVEEKPQLTWGRGICFGEAGVGAEKVV